MVGCCSSVYSQKKKKGGGIVNLSPKKVKVFMSETETTIFAYIYVCKFKKQIQSKVYTTVTSLNSTLIFENRIFRASLVCFRSSVTWLS